MATLQKQPKHRPSSLLSGFAVVRSTTGCGGSFATSVTTRLGGGGGVGTGVGAEGATKGAGREGGDGAEEGGAGIASRVGDRSATRDLRGE
jgi:hypothetical protein